jgi:hypothetical protein
MYMLWFGYEMFPKRSSIEGLVSNAAMFRDGTLGKGLDHEDSNLINALIY